MRAKFGQEAVILIETMNAKIPFRRIRVGPGGALNCEYTIGGYVRFDVRLELEWRGSPAWWGVVVSEMQEAQRNTTK